MGELTWDDPPWHRTKRTVDPAPVELVRAAPGEWVTRPCSAASSRRGKPRETETERWIVTEENDDESRWGYAYIIIYNHIYIYIYSDIFLDLRHLGGIYLLLLPQATRMKPSVASRLVSILTSVRWGVLHKWGGAPKPWDAILKIV